MFRGMPYLFPVMALLAGLLPSCATFAPAPRTAEELDLPPSFTLYEDAAPAPDRWWEGFGSAELTGLVEESLGGNFTLRQAAARLRQAEAVVRQARAARFPSVGYGADASVTRTHTESAGSSLSPAERATQTLNAVGALTAPAAGTPGVINAASLGSAHSRLSALNTLLGGGTPNVETTRNVESYGLGLTAAYEVDLWGRLKAGEQASRLSLEATRADLHDAMEGLAAQVTLTWLDMLYNRQALAVVEAQLKANRDTLELLELRYRKGQGSALDIYQQRQAVAQAESTIPLLKAGLETLGHELAVLLGRAPVSGPVVAAESYPALGPLPERGIPADLLALRSDVRAAGLRLASADWQVSAARADRLPSLTLTGAADVSGAALSDLFDDWMARLAASVTGPVFDAGRRKAEVERTRAVVEERLAAYRLTVLTAVKEVENALSGEARQGEYVAALERQYAAARATHEEARVRYMKGLNDYLPVLSALTNAQALERSLVAARRDLAAWRVQLHLALGGTWMAGESADVKDGS